MRNNIKNRDYNAKGSRVFDDELEFTETPEFADYCILVTLVLQDGDSYADMKRWMFDPKWLLDALDSLTSVGRLTERVGGMRRWYKAQPRVEHKALYGDSFSAASTRDVTRPNLAWDGKG